MTKRLRIIGAGLAGCEAAWQAALLGIPVHLIDMKPNHQTPAHTSPYLAELVCSNSLRAKRLENAVGLLKEEMRRLGSLILMAGDYCEVPAGGALAVDREEFSRFITERVCSHPLIQFETRCVETLPKDDEPTIIATGPLTDGALLQSIKEELGDTMLHFFDAVAPIVERDSINDNVVFSASRYGRGGDDYINCPMSREQYETFYEALVEARLAEVRDFERDLVFEGCMPIETMAKRGVDTIRYGPLKPIGLIDPRTGKEPYACVQLRQDNTAATLIIWLVFKPVWPSEQRRVFALIPGLENAVFARYGVMHRNTFICSPNLLTSEYRMREGRLLYFAGQLTGVEDMSSLRQAV